jgi:hypothetical protein
VIGQLELMKHELPPTDQVKKPEKTPISEIAHKVRVREAKIAHIESQETNTHPIDNLTGDEVETIVRRKNIEDGLGNTASNDNLAEAERNLRTTRQEYMDEHVKVTQKENEAFDIAKNLAYEEALTKTLRGDRKVKRASGSRGTKGVFESVPSRAEVLAKKDTENNAVIEDLVSKDFETEQEEKKSADNFENILTTRADAVASGIDLRKSYKDQSLDTEIDNFDPKVSKKSGRVRKTKTPTFNLVTQDIIPDFPEENKTGMSEKISTAEQTELPTTTEEKIIPFNETSGTGSEITGEPVVENTTSGVVNPDATIPFTEEVTPDKKSNTEKTTVKEAPAHNTKEAPKKGRKTAGQIARLAASYEAKRTKIAQDKEGIKGAPIDTTNILVPFSRVTNEELTASEHASRLAKEELVARVKSEGGKENRVNKKYRTPTKTRVSGSRASRKNESNPDEPDYGFAQYDQATLSENEVTPQRTGKEVPIKNQDIIGEKTPRDTTDSENAKKNVEAFKKSQKKTSGAQKNIDAFKNAQRKVREVGENKEASLSTEPTFGGAGLENKTVVTTKIEDVKNPNKPREQVIKMAGKTENTFDTIIAGGDLGNEEVVIDKETGNAEVREFESENKTEEARTEKENVAEKPDPNKQENSIEQIQSTTENTTSESTGSTAGSKERQTVGLISAKINLEKEKATYDRIYYRRYSPWSFAGFGNKDLRKEDKWLGFDKKMIWGFPTLRRMLGRSDAKEEAKMYREMKRRNSTFDPKKYTDSFSEALKHYDTEIKNSGLEKEHLLNFIESELMQILDSRKQLSSELQKYAYTNSGRVRYFSESLKNPRRNPRLTEDEKAKFVKLAALDEILEKELEMLGMYRAKKTRIFSKKELQDLLDTLLTTRINGTIDIPFR